MHTEEIKKGGRRLVTVKDLPDVPGYSVFSQAALRHLIFKAEPRVVSQGKIISGNGLNRAIIRIGRRVLIDLDAFDAWLDGHREATE